MSISTRSAFFFGHIVDETNNRFDFDEGSGELNAIIDAGSFSLTDYLNTVLTAINAVAVAQTYSIVLDRVTRQPTISAPGNFSILIGTGTFKGTSAYTLLGYTGLVDLTGTNSYQADSGSGQEYLNQFVLAEYVAPDEFQDAAFGVVNKSTSGLIETVSFGIESFFEFNNKFITSISQSSASVIQNNPTGKEDAVAWLQAIVKKGNFEFMPDVADRSIFFKVLLESMPSAKTGLGYKLREHKKCTGAFETGKMTLRVVL